jgi:hypothetical protein
VLKWGGTYYFGPGAGLNCRARASSGADQDRTNVLLRKSCEGRLEIAMGSGLHKNKLQAQHARCRLQVCSERLDTRKGRVGKNAEPGSIGYDLAE